MVEHFFDIIYSVHVESTGEFQVIKMSFLRKMYQEDIYQEEAEEFSFFFHFSARICLTNTIKNLCFTRSTNATDISQSIIFFLFICCINFQLRGRSGKHCGQKRTYRAVSNTIKSDIVMTKSLG